MKKLFKTSFKTKIKQMKKMFFIAALAVFGMTSADAQVSFGVKAGPQLTNFVGSDVEESDMKVGFNVGGYANIRFSEQLAFQPELLFSLQGDKYEETILGQDVKYKSNFSYINVPLMMKWYAYEGLNFEFGPQVGFNVGAKGKVEGGDSSFEGDIDDVSGVNFGLNIGAGYELPMGLNFGIRYGRGLNSVYTLEDTNGDKFKIYNSTIALGVGYTF